MGKTHDMLEADGIPKSVARTEAALRGKIAPTIDPTNIAGRGAKTRKKRRDDRALESSPPLPG